ncbi:phosphate ABC transporter permease PstA [Conexibacter stalactiti]|uniref:Phosphate transport system permease protein PstA n=1 Tax=Conexibacter stalactiti TaxID=1940611 RepID=A0ABU4HKY3_9ACTN|nr:phosphate ABC transporter permease PstA [Conexibacter stalactiti]MDW5593210.1 phosphate ABC transporter permease PstA [Conexibacter stalactiti]MEC5033851.1 phosphate ABC transporter permease PstA [Conexibacter stalactiti]
MSATTSADWAAHKVLPTWVPGAASGAGVVLGVAGVIAGLPPIVGVLIALAVVTLVLIPWSIAVEGSRRARDRMVTVAVTGAFALAVAPLISLLWTVVDRGMERFDMTLFSESMRGVVGAGGGVQHAIVGTLVITGLATLASVPVGVLAAIYLHEYGRGGKLARSISFFVDVMTGIPSIVAGLFAYALFALIFGPGIRMGVIGSVALCLLMIPIVVRSTEEMLRVVPNHLREAAYGLGVPKWLTIVKVVLPTAFAGIVTGCMLAIARVVGETAPLLITTGAVTSVNANPFGGRMENLAVFAYNQYANPGVPRDPYIARAWAAALTLLLIVMVLSLLARVVSARFGVRSR